MSLKCGHCQCDIKRYDVQILPAKSQFIPQRAHFYQLYFPPNSTIDYRRNKAISTERDGEKKSEMDKK